MAAATVHAGAADVEARVRAILSACAAGDFREPSGPAMESGWSIQLPSGRSVSRSLLQRQAEPLVALGLPAVDPLIAWVGTARDQASRYVAIFALQQLTGRRPHVAWAAVPDADTLGRAAAEWRAGAAERQTPAP